MQSRKSHFQCTSQCPASTPSQQVVTDLHADPLHSKSCQQPVTSTSMWKPTQHASVSSSASSSPVASSPLHLACPLLRPCFLMVIWAASLQKQHIQTSFSDHNLQSLFSLYSLLRTPLLLRITKPDHPKPHIWSSHHVPQQSTSNNPAVKSEIYMLTFISLSSSSSIFNQSTNSKMSTLNIS